MDFSIQAAIDLYGANSNEVVQVKNAWRAVGVYDELITAPTNLHASLPGVHQVDLAWTDNYIGEAGFNVERSLASSPNFSILATLLATPQLIPT